MRLFDKIIREVTAGRLDPDSNDIFLASKRIKESLITLKNSAKNLGAKDVSAQLSKAEQLITSASNSLDSKWNEQNS